MSVAPMPDPRAALIAYLREQDSVTALVRPEHIRQQAPPAGIDYAIQVNWAPGLGAWDYTPHMRINLDVRCFGPTEYEAGRLWRTVHALLVGDRQRVGFTREGCRISDVAFAAGPIDDLAGDDWPLVYASYSCLVAEVPVPSEEAVP